MREELTGRIAHLALGDDIAHALARVAADDTARLALVDHVAAVIPAISHILGGDEAQVAPFGRAWLLMYAAIRRLDQLQDGDPVDSPLPMADDAGAQYNFVFGMYLLATSMLDDLPATVAPTRMLRLHRLWSDCMLRMAAGQQRDLAFATAPGAALSLDTYQQIALAKTGATFALAFGGTAAVLTDDAVLVDALRAVGELYGALVQYGDDILDAAQQRNQTLTLPRALAQLPLPAAPQVRVSRAFWAYLYPIYRDAVSDRLAQWDPALRAGVRALFVRSFETPMKNMESSVGS